MLFFLPSQIKFKSVIYSTAGIKKFKHVKIFLFIFIILLLTSRTIKFIQYYFSWRATSFPPLRIAIFFPLTMSTPVNDASVDSRSHMTPSQICNLGADSNCPNYLSLTSIYDIAENHVKNSIMDGRAS